MPLLVSLYLPQFVPPISATIGQLVLKIPYLNNSGVSAVNSVSVQHLLVLGGSVDIPMANSAIL